MSVRDLTPKDVQTKLKADEITLIDVREPDEYAAERIHGALLFPLSTFDPHALPHDDGKPIVFHCGSGIRSVKAIDKCRAVGLPHDSHLAGGLRAWKAAGLPTMSINPDTGRFRKGR